MTANVTTPPSPEDAEAIERVVEEAIEHQPPTAYSFVAQNAAVETARSIKYARTIGRKVARALARRTQAAEGERDEAVEERRLSQATFRANVEETCDANKRAEAAEADAARMREALEEVREWLRTAPPIGTEGATRLLSVVLAALTPPQAPAVSANSGEA